MAEPVIEIRELAKFNMYTPAPNTPGKMSRLAWCSKDSNPLLTVFTGVAGDTQGKGVMSLWMTPELFLNFVNRAVEFCVNKETGRFIIESFQRDKDSNTLTPREQLVFGKTPEGIVYIAVTLEGRPKIKFDFQMGERYRFLKDDGSYLSPEELSTMTAINTLNAVRDIYVDIFSGFRKPYGTISNASVPTTQTPIAKAAAASASITSIHDDDIPF
jgi:hypothetical protein